MEDIPTGLPQVTPISWATRAGPLLFTAHVPLLPDGTFETGPFEVQCVLTFGNLRQAVEAAGGSMADVAQVVVYLTDMGNVPALTDVWTRVFSPPYPNRAMIGCTELAAPGIGICITATAVIASPKSVLVL